MESPLAVTINCPILRCTCLLYMRKVCGNLRRTLSPTTAAKLPAY